MAHFFPAGIVVFFAVLVGTLLATVLAMTACRYSDVGVGKGGNLTSQQALGYARDLYGLDLPAPIEEHIGTGPAVAAGSHGDG